MHHPLLIEHITPLLINKITPQITNGMDIAPHPSIKTLVEQIIPCITQQLGTHNPRFEQFYLTKIKDEELALRRYL